MPWIKAVDKNADGFKLARLVGSDKSFPAMFATHVIAGADGKTYKKEDIEWLDESEPSFTISDIIFVWAKAQEITIENTSYDKIDGCIEVDYSYIEKERNEFFETRFGIDITK